jgi:proteasome lid subunit RPN8/RPN11
VIQIARSFLERIERAAEVAYPEECCGLLVGRRGAADDILVTRVAESANVTTGDARTSFEVDPRVLLALMKEFRGRDDDIVGLYHSHPDHSAEPSARDLDRVFEPDLVWLITAVAQGRSVETRAHVYEPEGPHFRAVALRATMGEEGGQAS